MNASLTSETSELLFNCIFFGRGLNMSRDSKFFKYRQHSLPVSATPIFGMGGEDVFLRSKYRKIRKNHHRHHGPVDHSLIRFPYMISCWSDESCYSHPSTAGDGRWYPLASEWCFPSYSRTTTNLRPTLETWLATVKKSQRRRMAIH